MALLLAVTCILGNKHESKKTIIEKQFIGLVLMSVLTYAALPQSSLAFEVEMKNAPARKLVAPVRLLHSEDFIPTDNEQGEKQYADVVYEPEYSNRMVGSVVSYPPVETKAGTWQSRLAYSEPVEYKTPKIVPTAMAPVVLEGEASYYSREGCLGCNPLRIMANGQPLNDQALTMAIGANLKHLVGYRAKVTNVNTNQSVDVLITDTGGFYQAKYGNRVADLTIAAKQAIGMRGGVGQVRVEIY
jgi:rare lipoprotein A (peptidoglycan hydrolase)